MKRSRLTLSLSTALLWTVVVAFSIASLRFSDTSSQSLFVGGSCAAAISLLQQLLWLWRLRELQDDRNVIRLAMLWRLIVVVAMVWAFAVLAASQQDMGSSQFYVR